MNVQLVNESILPLLEEEDLEQMRHDTRKLVAENTLLRERVALLESYIVTNAVVDWTIH